MGQADLVICAVQTINDRSLTVPVQESTATLAVGSEIVVLPILNGGRGPIINEGEIIDVNLLLTLLDEIISENQLTPALQARLDSFGDLIAALDLRLTALEP